MDDDDDYEMDNDDYDEAYDSLTEESRREKEVEKYLSESEAGAKEIEKFDADLYETNDGGKSDEDETPTRSQSVDTNLGNKRWAKRFLDDMKDDD